MCTSKTLYLGELQRCVDEVSSGHAGAILHDRKLVDDYEPGMLGPVWDAVVGCNDGVRAELIMLLAVLNEGSVRGDVEAMTGGSSPVVEAACRVYSLKVGGPFSLSDCLADAMEAAEGPESKEAVRSLMRLVGEDDVPGPYGIGDRAQERNARDIGVLLRMLMVRNPHLDIDEDL